MSNIAATLSLNVPAITALCVGPKGASLLTGNGAPSTVGSVNDYYIDLNTYFFYGPKTALGGWGAPVFSLVQTASGTGYTIFNANTSIIVPRYGSNVAVGENLVISGGINNRLSGSNSFTLGSNLIASGTNFTFVDNLSSKRTLYSQEGNSIIWGTTTTTLRTASGTWQQTTTTLNQNSAIWTAYQNTSGSFLTNTSAITSISANAYNAITSTTSIQPVSGRNSASGVYSLVGGGANNLAVGSYSTVTGGLSNTSTCSLGQPGYSFIGNGFCNCANTFAAIVDGCCNRATGNHSTIVNGLSNISLGTCSFIGNGICNSTSVGGATIVNGCCNRVSGINAIVVGGRENTASSTEAFVGNGLCNNSSGARSAVVAGVNNTSSGAYSFIAAGSANDTRSFANTFILGTGLSANQINYTFVNNISSQNSLLVGGNAGFGTGTPLTKVHVAGSGGFLTEGLNDYYGGGAYFSGVNWRNSRDSFGGWALRNIGGHFSIWSGANPGGVGTPMLDWNERLRVDSVGNVGIGTLGPGTTRLDVALSGTAASNDGILVRSGANSVTIKPNSPQGANNGLVQLNDTSIVFTGGSINTGALSIVPWSSTTGGVRIDNVGRVGIGAITPSTALTVNGSISSNNTTYNYVSANSNWAYTFANSANRQSGFWMTGSGSGQVALRDISNNLVAIDTNNVGSTDTGIAFNFSSTPAGGSFASLMTILTSGNIGIGTRTPTARLTVTGQASAYAFRANQGTPNGDNTTCGYAFGMDGDTGMFSPLVDPSNGGGGNGVVSFATNNIERMRLDASGNIGLTGTNVNINGGLGVTGNVGIGTNTPGRKLDILGDSIRVTGNLANGTYLTLDNSGVAGGKAWNITSAGSSNGSGAGALEIYTPGGGNINTQGSAIVNCPTTAKAWVVLVNQVNTSGASQTILTSHGIASVVRGATAGTYTITRTGGGTWYGSIVATPHVGGNGLTQVANNAGIRVTGGQSTSSLTIQCYVGATNTDMCFSLIYFGL